MTEEETENQRIRRVRDNCMYVGIAIVLVFLFIGNWFI